MPLWTEDSGLTNNRKATSEELAYLAGIIDGEGTIGIYLNSVNGNYQLRMAVEMTDFEAIDLFQEIFGGTSYIRKPDTKPNRKAKKIWYAFNSQASEIIIQLLPYLRVKKKQALCALRADWKRFRKRKMQPEEQSLRKELHQEMRSYNQRGKETN